MIKQKAPTLLALSRNDKYRIESSHWLLSVAERNSSGNEAAP
jgi:hypothetical protein